MEVFTMAKKNSLGFRNEVIKEYTPEQIQELRRQQSVIESFDVRGAYMRIMLLLTQFTLYFEQFVEFTEKSWEQFVEEVARLRERKNDGFICFSMLDQLGGDRAKDLFDLVENKAIFGVLAYNMAKYIQENRQGQDYTLEVMRNLTLMESWSFDYNIRPYAARQFYGKSIQIFSGNRNFTEWLMAKFDINDYRGHRGKEFVRAFAYLYISLEKLYRENPEKIARLLGESK